MRLIGLSDAKAHFGALIDRAQHQRVLITRRGRPAALVIGVEGQDLEEVLFASDVAFWKMIQARRRRGATLTSDDVRRSFGIETPVARTPASHSKQPRGGRREAGAKRRFR